MITRLKNSQESLYALTIITLIGLVAYLPPLWRLGYYWDDWFVIWEGHRGGAGVIYDNLVNERILTAGLFSLSYRILGEAALGWHLTELLLRVLGGWAFYWLCREVWRERQLAAVLTAALFITYPGFLEQHYAIALHNYFTAALLGLLSLAASVRALRSTQRKPRLLFACLAVLGGLGYLLMVEGFIGLEALRLILIIYIIHRDQRVPLRELLRKSGAAWLAYALMIATYLAWQTFLAPTTRSDMNLSEIAELYIENPIGRAEFVAYEVGRDFANVALRAWTEPWYQVSSANPTGLRLSYLALAGLGSVLLIVYARHAPQPSGILDWAGAAGMIGLIATPLLILPLTLVLRDVGIGGRDALPASVGAVLLMVGLGYRLLPRQAASACLIFLLGISIYTQLNHSRTFTLGWERQRSLWWQLSWRAPQIGPGTVLVVDTAFEWDQQVRNYEISSPANLIYAYQSRQFRVQGIQLTERNLPLVQSATWNLDTNYANSLLLYLRDPDSCLRVIDNTRLYELPSDADKLLKAAAPYSHTDLILLNEPPAAPPPSIFGVEPPRGWCFYLQKAELARQYGDWAGVAHIGETVRGQGLQPRDAAEWLPFVEGTLRDGQPTAAAEIVTAATRQLPTLDTAVCTLFDRLRAEGVPPASLDFIQTASAELACFDLHRVWSELVEPDALVFYPSNVFQLPITAPPTGLVREIDVPYDLKPLIADWRSSKAANALRAAGISYVLVDQAWWQYASPQDLAALQDPSQYELLHEWHKPRTGEFYRLYRVK